MVAFNVLTGRETSLHTSFKPFGLGHDQAGSFLGSHNRCPRYIYHHKCQAFLARRQNPDGGYPLTPGGTSNAQSTAWAIQGLRAAGRNPNAQHLRGARNPTSFLRSLTTRSGGVRYSRTSAQTPVWVTAQALTGLAIRPFPIRARGR